MNYLEIEKVIGREILESYRRSRGDSVRWHDRSWYGSQRSIYR